MNQLMKMGMYANQVASAPPALVEYLSASHPTANRTQEKYCKDIIRGQSFSCGKTGALSRVQGYFFRPSSVSGDIIARIYTHSGTYGSSSIGGTLIASSTPVAKSTLSTSLALVDFNFAVGTELVSGTNYVVGFDVDANGDGINLASDYSTRASGNYCYQEPTGSTWGSGGSYDLIFYVYVKA